MAPLLILWDLLKYSHLQSRRIILVEKQIFTRRLELPRLKMRGVRRYGVAQGVGPVATLLSVTKRTHKNTLKRQGEEVPCLDCGMLVCTYVCTRK